MTLLFLFNINMQSVFVHLTLKYSAHSVLIVYFYWEYLFVCGLSFEGCHRLYIT